MDDWKNQYTITGFLEQEAVADLLYTCDVVVLPFRTEVTPRNGSFLAARLQGTPILTTSKSRLGFDADECVYYCKPNDVEGMQNALKELLTLGLEKMPLQTFGWWEIAEEHVNLYLQAHNQKK